MKNPKDRQSEPAIFPLEGVPVDWQTQITSFLSGDLSKEMRVALREKIQLNLDFRTYVKDLADAEARLATLLAEARYQQSEPMEPPAWAMERLRGTVARIARPGTYSESKWAQLFSWFTLPRLVLAGSSVAVVMLLLVAVPRVGDRFSELATDSPEIKGLLNLSPETFIASVGSPNVVRSTGRYIYSPSGVTSQIDPIVLLSPDLNLQNMKIEVSAPGKPEWIPIQGDLSGVPQPLSKILQKSPGLQAGAVYQIRLIAGDEIISDETFRVSDQPDLQVPESPSALLQDSLEAVNDVPPRPGDALALLRQLPEKYQNDQAVIRVRYKALNQIGAVSEAINYRNRIR